MLREGQRTDPRGGAEGKAHTGIAFAALHHRDYRVFFGGNMLTLMGDSVEHVISYWMIYQAFQSPVLGGFAVISHWTPYLLFSVTFGTLADRFDCRKIIVIAQVFFLAASVGWGLLFLTGALEVWHAVVLLIVHGMAGALRSPASQLIIHDIVGPGQLQSAVRLNSTGVQLGLLAGPAVGGAAMLVLGPAVALLVNAVMYVPLSVWLMRTPYSGHRRTDQAEMARVQSLDGRSQTFAPPRSSARIGVRESLRVLRELSGNRTILAMVALAGFSSLLVGNAYQAQMPAYARDLGADEAGVGYSLLFAANAGGAALGGVLLEGGNWLPPRPGTAIILAAVWCFVIVGFAAAASYPLAFALLVVAGVLQLGFGSMAQTLVQLEAPMHVRGRAVGLLNMANQGLRVGSGVTVGVLGALLGVHWSLGLSAAVLLAITLCLLALLRRSEGKGSVLRSPSPVPLG